MPVGSKACTVGAASGSLTSPDSPYVVMYNLRVIELEAGIITCSGTDVAHDTLFLIPEIAESIVLLK